MLRRVVVTGIGGITAFGRDWASIQAGLAHGKNAVQRMNWAEQFPELEAQLGAPIPHYSPLPIGHASNYAVWDAAHKWQLMLPNKP